MRKFIVAVLVGFAVATPPIPSPLAAPPARAADVAGLRDTLLSGLRVQTKTDRQFIDKVVSYVQQNKLTRKTVTEVFQYTRRKIESNRRPIVFQILLRRRARKLGVTI